jgi:hypothetical protein
MRLGKKELVFMLGQWYFGKYMSPGQQAARQRR